MYWVADGGVDPRARGHISLVVLHSSTARVSQSRECIHRRQRARRLLWMNHSPTRTSTIKSGSMIHTEFTRSSRCCTEHVFLDVQHFSERRLRTGGGGGGYFFYDNHELSIPHRRAPHHRIISPLCNFEKLPSSMCEIFARKNALPCHPMARLPQHKWKDFCTPAVPNVIVIVVAERNAWNSQFKQRS